MMGMFMVVVGMIMYSWVVEVVKVIVVKMVIIKVKELFFREEDVFFLKIGVDLEYGKLDKEWDGVWGVVWLYVSVIDIIMRYGFWLNESIKF